MNTAIIPVYCPHCGAIFRSRAFSIAGNVSNLVLSNNRESCPFCGKLAQVADGVFSVQNGVLSIIKAPWISTTMLELLKNAAIESYEKRDSLESFAEKAALIDPRLGEAIRKHGSGGLYITLFLLMIVFAIKSCSLNVTLDANQIIEQMTDRSPQALIGNSSMNSPEQ